MRAARFYGKEDLRYEENVAEPQDILPGQVLVKPTFCGICGTDLHEYRDGATWTPNPRNAYSGAELPQILGHEFAGEVVEVGSEMNTSDAPAALAHSAASAPIGPAPVTSTRSPGFTPARSTP